MRGREQRENLQKAPDILFRTQRGDCADNQFAGPADQARHTIAARLSETRSIDAVGDIDDTRSGQSPDAARQIFEVAGRDDDQRTAGECPSPEKHPAQHLGIRLAATEAGFQMQVPADP